MKKDDTAQVIRQEWIKTLPNNTILCYTDRSRLDNRQVGSGFSYYQVSKGKTIKLSSYHCYLWDKAEIYDAELHACFEALRQINIHHLNLTKVHIIQLLLSSDTHSYQYARQTIEETNTLSAGGIKINTTWTPSHINIQGNEDVDIEAKRGATNTNVKCQHAVTTKTWMLAESKGQFLLAWKQKLPDSKPSLQYPPQMSSYNWTETRALARVYCNRSPTDNGPYKPPTQRDTRRDFTGFENVLEISYWTIATFQSLFILQFCLRCKIIRFSRMVKCQRGCKGIKVFKNVFAVRSSERVDLFFSTLYLIQRVLPLVYIQLFPP
jgi:hypothetical protein